MVLSSHSELGNTGKKIGFLIEEFAASYCVFMDVGASITIAYQNALSGYFVSSAKASGVNLGYLVFERSVYYNSTFYNKKSLITYNKC